jgi:putative transposase
VRGLRDHKRTQSFLSSFGRYIRQDFVLKWHSLRASRYRKQLATRFARLHRFTELILDPFAF